MDKYNVEILQILLNNYYCHGGQSWSINMFFAIMLVCSPMNLIYHEKECFGIEDTKGYYSTEAKCNKRINEMENELLHVINYPAVISKNCIKVKLEAV